MLVRRLCATQRTAIRFLSSRLSVQVHHGAMLVALVQGIVSSFHKYLPPLDERGGEESRYRADDHLLHESGVHSALRSIDNAIKWLEALLITRIPTARSS